MNSCCCYVNEHSDKEDMEKICPDDDCVFLIQPPEEDVERICPDEDCYILIQPPTPQPGGSRVRSTFSCNLCGYTTRVKGTLKQHFLVHTDLKPFSCTMCVFRCKRKGNLKRHIKKYHEQYSSFC